MCFLSLSSASRFGHHLRLCDTGTDTVLTMGHRHERSVATVTATITDGASRWPAFFVFVLGEYRGPRARNGYRTRSRPGVWTAASLPRATVCSAGPLPLLRHSVVPVPRDFDLLYVFPRSVPTPQNASSAPPSPARRSTCAPGGSPRSCLYGRARLPKHNLYVRVPLPRPGHPGSSPSFPGLKSLHGPLRRLPLPTAWHPAAPSESYGTRRVSPRFLLNLNLPGTPPLALGPDRFRFSLGQSVILTVSSVAVVFPVQHVWGRLVVASNF